MVWPAIIGAAASLVGGALANRANRNNAEANNELQREFAQQGIRWKVADAKAAGIHPLYALGAQTHSFTPTPVMDAMGPALANAGQDIGRAIDASRTRDERAAAEAQAFQRQRELDMANANERELQRFERAHAQQRADEAHRSQLLNDEMQRNLMASQIARLNQQRNPPLPQIEDSRGSRDTGPIKLKPSEQPSRNPHNPSQEASTIPMWQRVETSPGVFRSFPSRELNMDSELVHAILAGQAYVDKWVSDNFFGGAPKYIQHSSRNRTEPSPGSYLMDRGYQRSGVYRKGR